MKRTIITATLIILISVLIPVISCTNPLQDVIRADLIEAANLDNSPEDTDDTNATPSAPSDLKATAMSTSQIDLTWSDNSDNETEFHIQRKTSSATDWQTIDTVGSDSTTYSDTGLSAETEYTYRVRARNEGGNSEWSEEAYARTISLSAPNAPSVLGLASDDDSGYSSEDNITNITSNLTFSGSSESDTTVSLYSDVDGYLGEVTTTTGDWLLDVNLAEGSHAITATATMSGETSGPSDGLTVTIDTTPPEDSPSILKPMQGTNTGTELTPEFVWLTDDESSYFEIQADNDSDFSSAEYSWDFLTGSSFTPEEDLSVSSTQPVGTRYYLRMRCVDTAGNTGSWSNSDMLRYINVGRFDQDFNGDGYSDVIGGAQYNDDEGSEAGSAYLCFGGELMNSDIDVTMVGDNSSDNFGFSVASAGDVNGDGYADALVGAPDAENMNGAAYIYYGGNTMNSNIDVTLIGTAVYDNFGFSVSSTGDVNGDGFADIIVGEDTYADEAFIFFGGTSMDSDIDVTLNSEGDYDNFGFCVASAGDVNGDGYFDAIVGAHYKDTTVSDAGAAYIFYGGINMDGDHDISMTGEAEDEYFGYSVASAKDINDDGYSDVIVGALNIDATTASAGSAYLFYGGQSMDNSADLTMIGETDYNYFGYSVASAGDINKDGYSDLIIGAYDKNLSAATILTAAYIFYGGDSMDETFDIALEGDEDYNNGGYNVSSAGDANGDGFSDLIFGAPGNDDFDTNAGAAYIFFGGSSIDNVVDITILGENSGDAFGCSVD